jgi:hypothetical protein
MPRIPFLDSHWEGVDILIQELDKTYWLNDRFIVSIHIQSDFVSWKQVSQTQFTLIQINVFELLTFQKLQKVSSKSSHKLDN